MWYRFLTWQRFLMWYRFWCIVASVDAIQVVNGDAACHTDSQSFFRCLSNFLSDIPRFSYKNTFYTETTRSSKWLLGKQCIICRVIEMHTSCKRLTHATKNGHNFICIVIFCKTKEHLQTHLLLFFESVTNIFSIFH